MQVILRLFKEVIFAAVSLAIIFGIGWWLFKEQLGFTTSDVPNSVTYAKIELGQYDIIGDLEDAKDPTKTYQATTSSLKNLDELRKVHTGTPNPFSSRLDVDSGTDLPSEKVGIKNEANPTEDDLINSAMKISGDGAPESQGGGASSPVDASKATTSGDVVNKL